ncbi:hypothetical protein EQG49_11325 [Periweissella cryptocerci]|uniref:Uncharacterized protein n=1 Tax=Periweissella cryptocerci TaxID=2506420 RepID=A0A4P6YW02_9LACO|nr:hypothetical protein [Periweissella cryptocerci]QBO36998.1 hypothetical protein EQG49_11325 [Periweissella cryptocerci]
MRRTVTFEYTGDNPFEAQQWFTEWCVDCGLPDEDIETEVSHVENSNVGESNRTMRYVREND